MLASRVKFSFAVIYPEVMIKSVDTVDVEAKGGTKWAPMFSSAKLFDYQFRIGSLLRVLQGVMKVHYLMQALVDRRFPLDERCGGKTDQDSRMINMVITDHNRSGYLQTTSFVEAFLPMHKMFVNAGLSNHEG